MHGHRWENLHCLKIWAWLPSSAEPLVFCVSVLQQVFYYAKCFAEPSCRTPKVLQNSEGGLGARARLFRTGFFLPIEDFLLVIPPRIGVTTLPGPKSQKKKELQRSLRGVSE